MHCALVKSLMRASKKDFCLFAFTMYRATDRPGWAAAAFAGQFGGNGAESICVGAGIFTAAIVRQPGVDRGRQPHGLCRLIRRGSRTGLLADAVGDLPVAHPRPSHERRYGRQLDRQLDRRLVISDADASSGQAGDVLSIRRRQHRGMAVCAFPGAGDEGEVP